MLSESLVFCLNIEDDSRTRSPIPFDLFEWHSWATSIVGKHGFRRHYPGPLTAFTRLGFVPNGITRRGGSGFAEGQPDFRTDAIGFQGTSVAGLAALRRAGYEIQGIYLL
jgi:hypothetical protein